MRFCLYLSSFFPNLFGNLLMNIVSRKKVIVEGSMHRPNKGERVTINYQESLQEYSDIIKGKGGSVVWGRGLKN